MKFALINKRNNKINFFHNVNNKYIEQKPNPKQVQPINNSNINVKNIRNMFSLLKSANRGGGGCGSCGGAK